MGHADHFLPDLYDPSYPNGNFITQCQLEPPLDIPSDLAGYGPFSKRKGSLSHNYHNSFYYSPTTTPLRDKQSSRPLPHIDKAWSHFDDVLDSVPPSPAWNSEFSTVDSEAPCIPNDDGHGAYPGRKGQLLSPLNGFRLQNLPQDGKQRFRETSSNFSPPTSYSGEPWSPPFVTTDTDDDSSPASSTFSLSPSALNMDAYLGDMPVEDGDDENPDLSPLSSPRREPIYLPLEEYPLRTSPHSVHDECSIHLAHPDDDNLSPLTYSPSSLGPAYLMSLSESEHQLNIKKSPTYSPPSYNYYSLSDYDSSTPVPCSPSRRRSATLPELEPATFNADPFGLHQSTTAEVPPSCDIDMDMSNTRWRSLPGCETDDDLIPVELASKNYIPDPSATVPTTSTASGSLLLWDHDHNDRTDIPTPRSPSPEHFYLDPTVLAECGDEEMQKVYELRQRTAKNEKWERERCRELSALLRLKLDERGVLGGGDYSNHQSDSRSPPFCSNLPFSSSPSGDSLTVYQPHSSSSSSTSSLLSSCSSILVPNSPSPSPTLSSTSRKPQSQSEAPKHKIRSMAQLVASMIFHRQSDALRRHLSKKPSLEPTSHHHPSTTGVAVKVLPTPRSRLSKVILPEELDMNSEDQEQGVGHEVESGDGLEDGEDIDVDDRPLSSSCMDMDLDEKGSCNSHAVTEAAPQCTHTGQYSCLCSQRNRI